MKNKFSIFILVLLIFFTETEAYLVSKGTFGKQVKWNNSQSNTELYFNASNAWGVSESTLQTIAANSASQWNFISGVSISKNTSAGKNQAGLNEMYFSDDPSVFNSSNINVMAITLTSFLETDGFITEADILINENYSVVTSINDTNYIGNIITHEMGHFLGLDHGQTIGSTMFYGLSRGQNQISDDDKTGLYSIYNSSNASRKSISGKVVGGKKLYGVYGASVEAISQSTGKIIGSTVSETDGSFSIDGLPINDKYFLYTKPTYASGLPKRYKGIKNDFCDGGKSYRGSFFQACGGGNEGYPQAVSLTSSNVNVGNVTVRCNLDVPPVYFQKKSNGDNDFNLISSINNGIGNSFVGFFSNQEINSGSSSDTFKIDLSSLTTTDWNNLDSGSLYLELHVLNQAFYSSFKANVEIANNLGTQTPSAKYELKPDGWIDIDTTIRTPIDKVTVANNAFTITITPEKMSPSVTPASFPASALQILPDYSNFVDELTFYLVDSQIVKSNGDGTYSQVSAKSYVLSDNSSCSDANNTYQLSNYSTSTMASAEKRSAVLGCGMIDTDNNSDDSNGPIGMIVGFSLAFLLFLLSKRMRFI
jgi:hypothetical protein